MSDPGRAAAGGRVVVTGAGLVGAWGLGLEPLAAALAAGEPLAEPVGRGTAASAPPRPGRGIEVAARVPPGLALEPWLSRREGRRMSPPSRFAVAAGRMALAEAGLPVRPAPGPPAVPDPALGVVLATAYGASSFTQGMLDQAIDEGPDAMSPYLFMESVANAPAGQVAIHCRAGGPNETLCQREAGPPSAVGRGAALVAAGRARRVLAGAVEEITPLLLSLLDRFGSLSARPRPFDRRRDGFLVAEGSTLLLLEPEDDALARGAAPLAAVRAWGGAFDPTAPRNDWGRGSAAVAAAIARGLGRAGLAPGDVDAVVSGASGARRGDRFEAETLRALFGPQGPPPVLAPKGVTGEYGGAYLAAALLVLASRPVGPVGGSSEPDPALGITPHGGGALLCASRVLVTGCAAGGSVAWVILESPGAVHR